MINKFLKYKISNFFFIKKKVLNLKNFHDSYILKKIDEEVIVETYNQFNDENQTKVISTEAPSVNIYFFKNALVNTYLSAVIQSNNLFIERINENERLNEGCIKNHNNSNAIVEVKIEQKIEEGFFLAGNGAWNWYHFLIEILPKLLLYKHFKTNILLVSEDVKKNKSMSEALNIIIDSTNFKIIYLKANTTYRVKNLYYINEVNKIEFNKLDSKINNLKTAYFRRKYILEIREKLTNNYQPLNNYKKFKKIFLWRENTLRIPSNQLEILDVLERRGFIKVDTSNMSLKDQIEIFSNTDFIVGTTGAAWTNMIFCNKKTKAIIFSPKFMNDFNAFSTISKICDVELHYLYYDTKTNYHSENHFVVDIPKLENLLNIYD